jgi:transposase-like protein
MPKQYAREFRRAICQRLVPGERVSSLSREVGVSEGTFEHWSPTPCNPRHPWGIRGP